MHKVTSILKMTQPRKHGEVRRWVYSPQALLDTMASLNHSLLPQRAVEALGETGGSLRLLLGQHYSEAKKGQLLMRAIGSNDKKRILRVIRQCNVDINGLYGADQDNKFSPLMHAIGGGANVETIRFLLVLGANPNQRITSANPNNNTTLTMREFDHMPLRNDIVDIYRVLIEHGANIDEQLALHRAVLFKIVDKRTDIIELFIERGANINMLNRYGATPLDLAMRVNMVDWSNREPPGSHTDLVDLIRAHGGMTAAELRAAGGGAAGGGAAAAGGGAAGMGAQWNLVGEEAVE